MRARATKATQAERCPVCSRPMGRTEVRTGPFCSPVCKLVDLGRWLDGSYRIPGPSVDLENVGLDGQETE